MTNFKYFNDDGTWKRENAKKYTAILELDKKLSEANIPHELIELMDGWKVGYPVCGSGQLGDAVEHMGSYGNEENLLEVYGFGYQEPKGWLSVGEALEIFIIAHEVYVKEGGVV